MKMVKYEEIKGGVIFPLREKNEGFVLDGFYLL